MEPQTEKPNRRPDLMPLLVQVEEVREALRAARDLERDEDSRDHLSVALGKMEDAHHFIQEAGA
jgi:hypothetical protein